MLFPLHGEKSRYNTSNFRATIITSTGGIARKLTKSMIWCDSRANGKVRMREATKEVPLENLVSGGFFYTDELD